MNLQPIVTFRQGRNRAWRVDSAERSWLIKEYVGPQGRENRDREKARLKLWLTRGYPVPAVGALTIPELDGTPWLAMEWLEGITLQEYLSDRTRSWPTQRGELEDFLLANRRRHSTALQANEPCLVHPDPNTSNVIIASNRLGWFWIDLEAPSSGAPLPDQVVREMAKLFRWMARDLGRERLPAVADLFCDAYAGEEVLLRKLVERTLARPFQWLHRWRDRARRKADPADITKYEVSEALRGALGARGAT